MNDDAAHPRGEKRFERPIRGAGTATACCRWAQRGGELGPYRRSHGCFSSNMHAGPASHDAHGAIAGINITPLVDVMLVLPVISWWPCRSAAWSSLALPSPACPGADRRRTLPGSDVRVEYDGLALARCRGARRRLPRDRDQAVAQAASTMRRYARTVASRPACRASPISAADRDLAHVGDRPGSWQVGRSGHGRIHRHAGGLRAARFPRRLPARRGIAGGEGLGIGAGVQLDPVGAAIGGACHGIADVHEQADPRAERLVRGDQRTQASGIARNRTRGPRSIGRRHRGRR